MNKRNDTGSAAATAKPANPGKLESSPVLIVPSMYDLLVCILAEYGRLVIEEQRNTDSVHAFFEAGGDLGAAGDA